VSRLVSAYFLLVVVVSLVVIVNAVDFLERLVSELTCYLSSSLLNLILYRCCLSPIAGSKHTSSGAAFNDCSAVVTYT